jgi:hypothetical protein
MPRLRSLVALVLFLAAALVMAQPNPPASPATSSPSGAKDVGTSGPLNNTTPSLAHTLIPDGTSVTDSQGATAGKFYVANVEQGKSYVLETHDPYGDLDNNCISTTVYDSDGTTTPPADAELDTTAAHIAPSMEVSDDGERIAIRPDIGAGFPVTRTFYFKVTQCNTADAFKIRLREATIYSRWTVNSYNYFVALQNTTATEVQVQLIYYGDAGGTTAVAFNSGVVVPAFGAIQITRAADSLAPNHGALRIQWWGVGEGLVPGQLNVQTYAFNVAAGNYLDFVAEKVNDGRTGRSW